MGVLESGWVRSHQVDSFILEAKDINHVAFPKLHKEREIPSRSRAEQKQKPKRPQKKMGKTKRKKGKVKQHLPANDFTFRRTGQNPKETLS